MDTVTFEMNGKAYETDAETLEMLRSIVPSAKETGDFSAVIAAMYLGEETGRIRLMGSAQAAGPQLACTGCQSGGARYRSAVGTWLCDACVASLGNL